MNYILVVLFQDIFRDTDEAVDKLENDYCLAIYYTMQFFSYFKNISLTIFFFLSSLYTSYQDQGYQIIIYSRHLWQVNIPWIPTVENSFCFLV